MEKVNRIIFLVSAFLIVSAISIINMFSASYNNGYFEITVLGGTKLDGIRYTNWFIFIIIITTLILFLSLFVIIFDTIKIKAKTIRLCQSIFLYINICIFVIVIVSFSILYLQESELLYDSASSDKISQNPFKYLNYTIGKFYLNNILLLLLTSIASLTLSILSLRNAQKDCIEELNKNLEETEKNNKTNNEIVEKTENSLIKSEINKLKQELELESLKKEYKELYVQLQSSKSESKEKNDK